MGRYDTPAADAALRFGGATLLVVATAIGHHLVTICVGHAFTEPAVAYPLALATFLGSSLGMTLAALGGGLFGRVIVADRWAHHVPATFLAEERDLAPPPDDK